MIQTNPDKRETKGHIFISYSRQDGDIYAAHLERALQDTGFSTWRDVRNLSPYNDFSAEIESAIREASHFIVVLTASVSANPSSFVRREVQYALMRKTPIIPLLFPGGEPLLTIATVTWVEFYKRDKPSDVDFDSGFQSLLVRLRESSSNSEVSSSSDPFSDYLEALYESIVDFLDQTMFRFIPLRSKGNDSALDQKYVRMLPAGIVGLSVNAGIPSDVRFDTFSAAAKYYDQSLLVLGAPGAGKTTTLMAYARDTVVDRLRDMSKPLPLVASVHKWDGASTTMPDWFSSMYRGLNTGEVSQLIDRNNMIFILDGLDELPDYAQIENFIDWISKSTGGNRIIISSRNSDYVQTRTKLKLKGVIELEPLGNDQLNAYLADFPTLRAVVDKDAALRDLVRTPLILSIFTFAFASLAEPMGELTALMSSLPDTLSIPPTELDSPDTERQRIHLLHWKARRAGFLDILFDVYLRRRVEFEEIRGSMSYTLHQIFEVLGAVAVNMLFEFRTVFEVGEIPNIGIDLEKLIDEATRLHIIVRNLTSYQFAHSYLKDFVAIEYCRSGLKSDNRQRKDVALRMFDYYVVTTSAVPLLIDVLKGDDYFTQQAASALGQIGDARAIDALINSLENTEGGVRGQIALALVKIGEPAIDKLCRGLQSTSSNTRYSCAFALGSIGNKKAIEPLMKALEDSDDLTRSEIIWALMQLDDHRLIGKIEEYETSENRRLRYMVAEAKKKLKVDEP